MSVVVNKTLDYSKMEYEHGQYKMTRSLPQSGTQTATLSGSGGQEFVVEIPPKCINLSRGFLSFSLNTAAQAAGILTHIFADCGAPALRDITVYTRGSVTLCHIPDVSNYLKMILRAETKIDELLTNSQSSGIFPCNSLNTANYTFDNAGAAFASDTSYLEPAYFLKSAPASVGEFKYRIPLNIFKNSILALDKDLLFNETILIKFTFNPINKIGFGATNVGATPVALTGAVSITNFSLFTAVQVDPGIIQLVSNQRNQGMNILFDYVYSNKLTLSGTTQALTLKYNRSNGQKLKKLYWSMFGSTESNQNAYNNFNLASQKLVNFYTATNNLRNQEFNLSNDDNDDYMLLFDKLRGSCVLNSNVHDINNVWIEDWTARDPLSAQPKQAVDLSNLSDGMSLDNELKYDIFATVVSATYNHYVYSVCEKILSLGPNGIMLI